MGKGEWTNGEFAQDDLEGLLLRQHLRNAEVRAYAYARGTVCMTDRDVLERLQEVTGIGRLEKIRPRNDAKHKPISQWVVCRNQEAIELMVAVYPHMGTRRQAMIREVLAQVEKVPA